MSVKYGCIYTQRQTIKCVSLMPQCLIHCSRKRKKEKPLIFYVPINNLVVHELIFLAFT